MQIRTNTYITYSIVTLLSIVIIFEMFLIFSDYRNSKKSYTNSEFLAYAAQVVDNCSESKHRPSCYDVEIPKLMNTLSLEDIFKVTSFVQEEDKDYAYCHVLGHNVSAIETAKDPSKWREVVARCPSGMCSNGCIHGAFQEKFRAEALPDATIEELEPELKAICTSRPGWQPTGLEQATCTHALGHLSMYVTNADIGKSLELCKRIVYDPSNQSLLQLCYDGAFMQIFQPLEPEDFALVEGKQPTREEHESYCSKFDDAKVRSSCWSEGWPLYLDQIREPDGLVDFCTTAPEGEVGRCFSALFYVLTAGFDLDPVKTGEYCRELPAKYQGQCFANGASRMIETDWRFADRAVTLCETSREYGVEDRCYNELIFYSTYNYTPHSEEFISLCNTLPNTWRDKCLMGQTSRNL